MTRGRVVTARAVVAAWAALAVLAVLTACSAGPVEIERVGSTADETPTAPTGEDAAPAPDPSYAVDAPGSMEGKLLRPDVLVTSGEPITDSLRARLEQVRGVESAMPLGLASFSVSGRTLTIASVDVEQYRRFTPLATARSDAVWERVAGGELAVDTAVGKKIEDPGGVLTLGQQEDAPAVHIGAYAPLAGRLNAVVNTARGVQLKIPENNALLVSTGQLTPSAVRDKMEKVLGDRGTLQILAQEFDVSTPMTAVLTGGSVATAVGSFDYTPRADGTVVPDPRWVQEYVRTEQVPVLGSVTCNKAMLPQFRSALTEIVDSGLADKINPGEYAGCYYPRFIGRDPDLGLSLHSWGIAFDINVPGNQRGTVGEMDRGVVAIFKKWGFAWGGDWNYTDPMHFELARLVKGG